MHSEIYQSLARCLNNRELVALATVVGGPGIGNQLLVWPRGETLGDLGSPRLNQRAALYAEQIVPSFQSGRKRFRWNEAEIDVFFEVFPPPPELVVVGAVHVAIPLVEFAGLMGFRTVVIDPRRAFATAERFPHADRLMVSWPHEAFETQALHGASFVVVLSHDLKIDLPALEITLRSPARYIGALGSKKTHSKRVDALSEKGFTDQEIGRIHSPIGLDIGGRRAEEIALSIIAEMVAADHGRLEDRECGL